jgi:hypothetical protein
LKSKAGNENLGGEMPTTTKRHRPSGPHRTNKPAPPLGERLGALERERARLEEEILQLKAAVHIWTDVFRQTVAEAKSMTSGIAESQ